MSEEEKVEVVPADTKVPDSWLWIKGSDGNASVSTTFVLIAFWVTTLLYISSAFVKIGPVELRPFDVAAAGVYWVPLLTLYFGRRYTEAKFSSDKKEG